MEIDKENVCTGIKRKNSMTPHWEDLLPTVSGEDDRPPEVMATSKNESAEGGTGADEKENKKEDLELLEKTDQEIEDAIARIRKYLQVLGDKMPDKGEKFKANLQINEIELERRKKLQSEKKYSTTSSPDAGIKPSESQNGVATNALTSDSLTDDKMQRIVIELVNVGISEGSDVGKDAEVLYKHPVKVKVLFALPSHMRRSYVDGLLHPQN